MIHFRVAALPEALKLTLSQTFVSVNDRFALKLISGKFLQIVAACVRLLFPLLSTLRSP